jgi:hypothetical protein
MRLLPLAAVATLFAVIVIPAESQLATSTGVWATKSSLPTPHSEVASAEVGGKIYILGGTVDMGTMAMPLNEEYDPATDRARERAPLPQPLSHIGVVGLNGKIYAVGGFSDVQADHTGAVNSLLVYDPVANTWRRTRSTIPPPIAGLSSHRYPRHAIIWPQSPSTRRSISSAGVLVQLAT